MKILVISSVRCGGYYFTKQLAMKYNLIHIHEPKKEEYISSSNNVVAKVLIYSKWLREKNIIEYCKTFDKVFVLDRRDKEEQLKSVWAMHEGTNNMFATYEWNDNMFDKKNPIVEKENYKDWLLHQTQLLEEVASKLNIGVIHYEDLYYNTTEVDLQGLEFTPDTSRRLRITNETTKEVI